MALNILVYGFGNPGRGDDGLGIAFADRVEGRDLPGVSCERNYQLNIEDALEIAAYDAVLFADASIDAAEPFEMRGLRPAEEICFTTHSMPAHSVLALCEDLYGRSPRAFMMAIRGYSWNAEEGLSDSAADNLEKAVDFAVSLLGQSSLIELENAASPSIKGRA
jgi:hydrogenase maturation protease